MAYVWKLVCGDETLNLHDGTNYIVAYHEGRFYTSGDLELPIIIQKSGGAAIGAGQRLKREIDRYLAKARAWESSRQGKPVDLVCKLDDGLGDVEPLYGRGHLRKRILDGAVIMPNLNPTDVSAGRLRLTLQIKSRPYYHGKLADVADATGWVREVADKGLEVWEATTNLFVNPCLAFPTDWDQRWTAYNTTDLVVAQSTACWRSLGSAAKLTASATLPGVFYDDLALTNAAHVLSAYVYKEGAVPTTNDVALWAGHVFENFTTAAAAPTAPLVEVTAGGGTVVVAGGECQIDTNAATADAAFIYYSSAFDADKIFRIRTRFKCPAITTHYMNLLVLSDKAAAPVTNNAGTLVIKIRQLTTGVIQIYYTDNAATEWYWNGTTNAWTTPIGATDIAYSGALNTYYRVDITSNGTSWQIILYDANDAALETCTAVTWALTATFPNGMWWHIGDYSTGGARGQLYADYVKIDVGTLTTTFDAVDSEHPGWYRATSAAFTMPSTTVLCGVEVKAGRYVYVDDLQIEAKSYATPFANGDLLGCAWTGTAHDSTSTRSQGYVKLNNRNLYADHGAVTFWYKPGLVYTSLPAGDFLDIDNTGVNTFELYWSNANARVEALVGSTTLNGAAQTWVKDSLNFVALTWDFTNDAYALYVNSDAAVTSATALTAPAFGSALLNIGNNTSGTANMNGQMYDLRIWGDALTATQIGLVRTAGRGLGELPWLWTAAADGVVYNHEDSTHGGSAWLGGVPGDIPAGMKLWVDPTPTGSDAWNRWTRMYIGLKELTRGPYQFKYPYVLEAESMTWDAGANVADADHSSGNYWTVTADDDPDATVVETAFDIFKVCGRWRVYARAACTGANTADWRMKILQSIMSLNTWAATHPYSYANVAGNNTADEYNWLDLGVVDFPPLRSPDEIYTELAANAITADYLQIEFTVDEVAAAETFRMDCVELLPDDQLLYVYTYAGATSTYYPLFIDSTDIPICGMVWTNLEYEIKAGAEASGTYPNPSVAAPSRLIVRKTYANVILAGTGGDVVSNMIDMQIQPRFEALR